MNDEMTIKVKVTKVVFKSESSGYTVCRAIVIGTGKLIVAAGSMIDIDTDDTVELKGKFVNHRKFGEQFKVESFFFSTPDDEDSIIKYLKSRIKGMGEVTAKKVVDHFGSDTFSILEDNPDRITEVSGLKKAVIEEVKKNFSSNKVLRELTLKLAQVKIGSKTIAKIYKAFKDDSLSVLTSNPYSLIKMIDGIGFKTADSIAQVFGTPHNATSRIEAGINYVLDMIENTGSLYELDFELIGRCVKILDVDSRDIEDVLDLMINDTKLSCDTLMDPDDEAVESNLNVIMKHKNFVIERKIADMMHNLSTNHNCGLKLTQPPFEQIESESNISLTSEQRYAVTTATANGITIITGGPGTGKTTVIKAIMETFKKNESGVLIAAPTGRAAKRIEEATGYEASTIHRMLQIELITGRFMHNEDNPLDIDAIIIDEFSMVDFFIFYSLLKAINTTTKIILIGDKDQLPSVGPGNVLRDLIESNFFPTIILNRNFRQEEGSVIIENAYRINRGQNIVIEPYSDDLDFSMIEVNSDEHARDKVLKILAHFNHEYRFNSQKIQILVPMYRGEAGIDNLNRKIQEQFNIGEVCLPKRDKGICFRIDDKVMQLKNNYELGIFNGEQGVICGVKDKEKVLLIEFNDEIKEYPYENINELTLSYAMSIHKSQGSEYDVLIIVMLPSHSIMLNRELFYTAVTRAKGRLFLVSNRQTVYRAISNNSPSNRKTMLQQRLNETFTGR